MIHCTRQTTLTVNVLMKRYTSYADALRVRGEWWPGQLELINLDSGGVIEIKTGQSDSEILTVLGSEVLYRVNTQIYKATIAADKVGQSTLVVDDDDVPEIHWAFKSVQ